MLLLTNRRQFIETPLVLCIDDTVLEFSDCIKFLGVMLDRGLSFSNHVNYICSKLAKTSGILRRISKIVPQSNLINLYYALVYPYLLYGVLVWGDAADANLASLILIQKKIIRIITSSHYLASSRPLFSLTGILPVKDIYKYTLGIHMYKKQSSRDIMYPNHSHYTRSNSLAIPQFQRLAQCQRSLSYAGPKCWNSIPADIRSSASLSIFKRRFKKLLLEALVN